MEICKHCLGPIDHNGMLWKHSASGQMHCYDTLRNELHIAEPKTSLSFMGGADSELLSIGLEPSA